MHQSQETSVYFIGRFLGFYKLSPLELRPGYLSFYQNVRVRGKYIVVIDCAYRYTKSQEGDDCDYLFRYEYSLNPPRKEIPHSHLHIKACWDNGCSIEKIHFPTSRISIEQVLAHLIIEHNVKPLRDDWFKVLAKSHNAFVQKLQDKPLFY